MAKDKSTERGEVKPSHYVTDAGRAQAHAMLRDMPRPLFMEGVDLSKSERRVAEAIQITGQICRLSSYQFHPISIGSHI
jgi:hypothetical protein